MRKHNVSVAHSVEPELMITAAVCYLAGSIPFGILLTRLVGAGDIRCQGSGNIGATNAVRVAGKKIGAAVFFLDALKCFLPVLMFSLLGADNAEKAVGAASGILGHVFPVWLKGRGGKGVSSYAGALAAVGPLAAVIYAFVWGGVFAWKRISGLAGVSALAAAGFIACPLLLPKEIALAFLICSLICIWRHKGNILALLKSGK